MSDNPLFALDQNLPSTRTCYKTKGTNTMSRHCMKRSAMTAWLVTTYKGYISEVYENISFPKPGCIIVSCSGEVCPAASWGTTKQVSSGEVSINLPYMLLCCTGAVCGPGADVYEQCDCSHCCETKCVLTLRLLFSWSQALLSHGAVKAWVSTNGVLLETRWSVVLIIVIILVMGYMSSCVGGDGGDLLWWVGWLDAPLAPEEGRHGRRVCPPRLQPFSTVKWSCSKVKSCFSKSVRQRLAAIQEKIHCFW